MEVDLRCEKYHHIYEIINVNNASQLPVLIKIKHSLCFIAVITESSLTTKEASLLTSLFSLTHSLLTTQNLHNEQRIYVF